MAVCQYDVGFVRIVKCESLYHDLPYKTEKLDFDLGFNLKPHLKLKLDNKSGCEPRCGCDTESDSDFDTEVEPKLRLPPIQN